MDNNNPQQPPVTTTPTIPPIPQEQVQQPMQSPALQPQVPPVQMPVAEVVPSEGGGKKMVIFLIIGIILITLAVGGIYYYLNFLQTPQVSQPTVSSENSTPIAAESAVAGVSTIETELNAVNVSSLDDAMNEIDKDINQL